VIDKESNVCIHYDCVKCCTYTKMSLSDSDVARIRRLGFRNFSTFRRDGYQYLRNLSGRCVFHNGKACAIYKYRPEGCRLYPAVFDENEGRVILHEHCPHYGEFRLMPDVSRRVICLIRKLDVERERLARSNSRDLD